MTRSIGIFPAIDGCEIEASLRSCGNGAGFRERCIFRPESENGALSGGRHSRISSYESVRDPVRGGARSWAVAQVAYRRTMTSFEAFARRPLAFTPRTRT